MVRVPDGAVIDAFWHRTLLPLDGGIYGLQPLHSTPEPLLAAPLPGTARHQPLAGMEEDKPRKKRFATYTISNVDIDVAEVRTEEGKLYLFVTLDRTSKLAFPMLEAQANHFTASHSLPGPIAFVPYQIRLVSTDNGIQFCHTSRNRSGPTAPHNRHKFDRVLACCRFHGHPV